MELRLEKYTSAHSLCRLLSGFTTPYPLAYVLLSRTDTGFPFYFFSPLLSNRGHLLGPSHTLIFSVKESNVLFSLTNGYGVFFSSSEGFSLGPLYYRLSIDLVIVVTDPNVWSYSRDTESWLHIRFFH